MKKVNFAVGVILILFSLFIFVQTFFFTQNFTGLSPAFFPRFILVIIFILSILLIVASFNDPSLSANFSDVFDSKIRLPLLIMPLIICYGLCLFYVGYLVSTIAFCFLFLYLLKVDNIKIKLIVSFVFPLILYFIFKKLFLVNLPSGFLI